MVMRRSHARVICPTRERRAEPNDYAGNGLLMRAGMEVAACNDYLWAAVIRSISMTAAQR